MDGSTWTAITRMPQLFHRDISKYLIASYICIHDRMLNSLSDGIKHARQQIAQTRAAQNKSLCILKDRLDSNITQVSQISP